MARESGQSFLSRASRLTSYQLAQKFIDFFMVVVLARILSPHDFGVVAAATIFVQLAQLVVEIGMGATVIQMRDLDERHLRVASTLVWMNAMLYFLLTQACAGLAADIMGSPEVANALRVLAFIFLFQALGIVPENLLVKRFEAPRIALQNLCVKFVGGFSLGIAMAAMGAGYWALVIPTVLGSLAKSVWTYSVARTPLRPLLDGGIARKLLRSGAGFSTSKIINFVALRGDNFLVGHLFGIATLGIYTRAYNIMSLPADLYGAIADRLVFPAFAKAQNDGAALQRIYLRGVELTALIGLPLSAGLFVLGEEWIYAVLGPKWSGVVAPFKILVFVTYFRLGMKIGGSVQRAKGAVRSMIVSQVIYACLVVGGCLIAYRYGLIPLCIAVSIGVVITYIEITWSGLRLTDTRVSWYLKLHLPGVALAAIVAGLLVPVVHFGRAMAVSPFLILLESAAVLGVFGALLLLLRPRWLLGDIGHEIAQAAWRTTANLWSRMRSRTS